MTQSLDLQLASGHVIRFADEKAALFFLTDASAVGSKSYDAWVVSPANDRSAITREDIGVINRTMRARSSVARWHELTSATHLPWLEALSPGWDLVSTSDGEWQADGCEAAIRDAMRALNKRHRRAASTTKLLHMKRPALIPVCDSYVAATMGMSAWDADSTTVLIQAIRRLGRDNLRVVTEVQSRLRSIGFDRTLARILDVLLWFTAPSSDPGPYGLFEQWLVTERAGRLFF